MSAHVQHRGDVKWAHLLPAGLDTDLVLTAGEKAAKRVECTLASIAA